MVPLAGSGKSMFARCLDGRQKRRQLPGSELRSIEEAAPCPNVPQGTDAPSRRARSSLTLPYAWPCVEAMADCGIDRR
jgi:hypothetical protein